MAEFGTRQANGVDTAQRLRQAASGLLVPTAAAGALQSRGGVIGLAVGAASGMSRTVGTGRGVVPGTFSAKQGVYDYVLDTEKTLTFDDGNSSARTDLVVLKAYDNAIDGSGQTKVVTEIVKGTPGAGVPATPVSSLVLFEQPVPANRSAGTGGLPAGTNKQPGLPTAIGGIAVVADQAARDALLVYSGLTVFRADLLRTEQYISGTWYAVPTQQTTTNTGNAIASQAAAGRATISGSLVTMWLRFDNVTAPQGFQNKSMGTISPFFLPDSGEMPLYGSPGGIHALATAGTGALRIEFVGAALGGGTIYLAGSWPIRF